METQQVRISSTEYVVRQVLLWSVLEHRNATHLYNAAGNSEQMKPLFFAFAGANGSVGSVQWNETLIRGLGTEDLMGIFIALERLEIPQQQQASTTPSGIIV